MTTKKFYAAYHTYSTEFTNDVAYLVRFDSKAARDAYVDGEQWDGKYHREAVTRKQAERIFPRAFKYTDERDYNRDIIDARDWSSDDPDTEFFAPYC